MRVRALIACVISTPLLGACIYVPPVWDLDDAVYRLEGIEEGITTKPEVLENLGEPDSRDKYLNLFTYSGHKSKGYVFAGAGYTGGGRLIAEELWWVKIYFDDDDVVAHVATSEEPESSEFLEYESKKKARVLKMRAEAGDPEAQFRMYQRSSSNSERWTWLCLSANQGHLFAQEEIGELNLQSRKDFWRIEMPDKPNKITAYVWYSLAVSNGSQRSEFFRDQVAEGMTDEEVAEADRLVAEWKPNPAECKEIDAQMDN